MLVSVGTKVITTLNHISRKRTIYSAIVTVVLFATHLMLIWIFLRLSDTYSFSGSLSFRSSPQLKTEVIFV